MEFIVFDAPPYDLQGSRGAEPDHENLSELPDRPTAWRTPAKSRAATAATVHRRIFPKGGKIARIDLQAAESTAESGNLSNLSAVFTHAHCKRGREDGIAPLLHFQWLSRQDANGPARDRPLHPYCIFNGSICRNGARQIQTTD
jgi:hypothetical protein